MDLQNFSRQSQIRIRTLFCLLTAATHYTESSYERAPGIKPNETKRNETKRNETKRSRMMRLLSSALLLATAAEALRANSWQSRLDKALLDVDAKPQARFRLVQRAFQDPKLLEDVTSAVEVVREKGFGKGHPEAINTLWPEGTIARADLEGLSALRSQVPELVESLRAQAPTLFSSNPPSSAAGLPDAGAVVSAVVGLATDPKKQEELKEEAKNALRATPKGLETPAYAVVATLDGPVKLGKPEPVEIRAYDPFTVARTTMKAEGDASPVFGTAAGGTGFNSLAGYLFGGNEEKVSMAMTMPVEISSSSEGGAATMAFVLPKENAGAEGGAAPPTPLAGGDVTVAEVPARLVAAKPFAGIVTDEEVERQRAALLYALGGAYAAVDPAAVSVLQYNAPYTVPWRRRNEVAVVVEPIRNPWFDAEGTDRGSWYDAGIRL